MYKNLAATLVAACFVFPVYSFPGRAAESAA
jgi:hypothetical protein